MMESRTPARRGRTKKPKVENYYKILGVRANATADSIKKSYIQLVKQFPPEQHPEQFQQIRRAYETLRDPAKRKEYDFQRKYGDSLTKLMDEVYERMEREEYGKAEELLRQAITLSPDSPAPRFALFQTLLLQDEYEPFEREEELFLRSVGAELRENVLHQLARLLYDMDYGEQALERIDKLVREYPDNVSVHTPLLIQIYRDLGRDEEAFGLIEARIPLVEEQKPEHFDLFLDWIRCMIHLGKWQYWSKVQPRVKKFLKSVTDEEDRIIVLSSLTELYVEYSTLLMNREAHLFAELAYYLAPQDGQARKIRQESQERQRLFADITRMRDDGTVFPLVTIQALRWYYEELTYGNNGSSALDGLMSDRFFEELESMDGSFFADGIRRIKIRYSGVYNRFRDKWEKLYEEKMQAAAD